MNRFINALLTAATLSVLLTPSVNASGAAGLTLETVRDLATSNSAAVDNAQHQVADALSGLGTTEADPYSLKIDVIRAQHAVENTRVSLGQTTTQANQAAIAAYYGLMEADESLIITELQSEIATISLAAANARYANGAATTLDVQQAQFDHATATQAASDAHTDRDLARQALDALLPEQERGEPLIPPSELPPVPQLDDLLAALQPSAEVLAARQRVEIAGAELGALTPRFDAPNAITAAQNRNNKVQEALTRVQHQATEATEQAHRAATRARSAYDAATEALTLQNERLDTQRSRHAAGLISELELLKAELDTARAEQALLRTTREYLLALNGLEMNGQ